MVRRLPLILALIPLMAAEPDYFPLHIGNQWVYRQSGAVAGDPVVVDIPRSAVFENRTYSLVRGLAEGDAWLRMDGDGTLYRFDPAARTESVWAVFSTPEGGTYRTAIHPCNQTASVASRDARVRVPAGEFAGALAIDYPPANCADAGLTRDVFLPYIGLVQRTSLTIAGPLTLSLSYARTGGVTVLSEPEVSFSLALDQSQYSDPVAVPVMTARMTLRVTQAEPVEITYPSGQRFDIEIRNDKGEAVWRWSDGKAFTLALAMERFGPGERNYAVRIPLEKGGSRFPPGRYTAEAWLATIGERRYAASVGFDILAGR